MVFSQKVTKLLCQIDEAYSADRRRDVRERLGRAWRGFPATGRVPYVVLHYAPSYEPDEALSEWENELLSQLHGILNHREWGDDYVPLFNFGIVQALIPACFGCRQAFSSDGRSVEVVPAVQSAADADGLERQGFGPGTLGGDMLGKMHFFHRVTEGRIVLAETDMQGPFSVASQIWGVEAFLTAIYDEPEAVHRLLDRTTDAIIEYIQRMLEVSEGNLSPCHCMPYIWMDKGRGACVSEDLLAVVSPSVTREFIAPYLSRIGRAFGGVLVHTCGSMNHSIKILADTPYLMGVNCSSSETDIARLVMEGGDKLVYLIHSSTVSCDSLPLLDCEGQLELFRKCFGTRYAGISEIVPFTTASELDVPATAGRLRELARL